MITGYMDNLYYSTYCGLYKKAYLIRYYWKKNDYRSYGEIRQRSFQLSKMVSVRVKRVFFSIG